MNGYIPLAIPNFNGNEKKYVDDAIEKAWVSTGGEYINKFENKLADFLHIENISACQSGTSAIHLSLIEAGVKPDDVVIVPTLTFIAAVNPVRYQFAHPVFMDCDDSLCMDPDKLRSFCEKECVYKTDKLWYKEHIVKAIVVVHIFGNMADMEQIMDIAMEYNIKVIEDATEALGTYYTKGKYKGKYAGTIGHFGAFSFNANKIITTGGGGAVTARDSNAVEHMRYLSTQAKDDSRFYKHNEIGFNYRMTNLQAALGVAQMEELPVFLNTKNNNYKIYREMFISSEIGELISFREGTYSNHWFYSLKINRSKIDLNTLNIRELVNVLEKRNIQTRAIWALVHKQKPYIGEEAYIVNKAEYYYDRILNIPSSTTMTREDVMHVGTIIKETLASYVN